ncbi:MAG: hypothetical protein GY861_06805 [bacterium]|nr:hypothetical protein [bacterium]
MPTLGKVQQMVKDLGKEADIFGTKKEIKHLPGILQHDEKIVALTSGMMDNNTWLVTCTNKRVIFLDKGMFYGLKQLETPLEKINSIEQKTGLLLGEISIWDGSSKMTIKSIPKQTVKPFVVNTNKAIQDLKQTKNQSSNNSRNQEDLVSQLEKLAALVDKGILTDDEFQAKKKQLLEIA